MSAGNHAALLMEHRFLDIYDTTPSGEGGQGWNCGFFFVRRGNKKHKERLLQPGPSHRIMVHFANCFTKPEMSQFAIRGVELIPCPV